MGFNTQRLFDVGYEHHSKQDGSWWYMWNTPRKGIKARLARWLLASINRREFKRVKWQDTGWTEDE